MQHDFKINMSATSSDLLHQASAIWKVLDELAARNPRKYFEFIKKTLNEGEEAGLGPPEAFKCLQTFKVVTNLHIPYH